MNELVKNHEFLCSSFIPFKKKIEGCYRSEQVLEFTREQPLSYQRPTLITGKVLMPFLIPISDTQRPRSKVKTPRRNWLLLQIIICQA